MNSIGLNNLSLNNFIAGSNGPGCLSVNTGSDSSPVNDAFSVSVDKNITITDSKQMAFLCGKVQANEKTAGDFSAVLAADTAVAAKTFAADVAASCVTGSSAVAVSLSEVSGLAADGIRSNDEAVELAGKLVNEFYAADRNHDVENGAFFDFLLEKFGYDALPVMVPEKELSSFEHTQRPIYRGLSPYREQNTGNVIRAESMADDFKHGKLFSGGSIGGYLCGRGTYGTFRKELADAYAEAYVSKNTGEGVCMKMFMAENAKVGRHKRGFDEQPSPDSKYMQDDFMEFLNNPLLSEKADVNIRELFADDIGSFAVLKGYDAYYTVKNGPGENDFMNIVILNRGKVIMQE